MVILLSWGAVAGASDFTHTLMEPPSIIWPKRELKSRSFYDFLLVGSPGPEPPAPT